ncbi:unnamed protein product [Dovyalis caffra]|uniref:Protein PGR n=1 Tax=Dovyalis caffra TaxID=77055 RepID=A0AAV1RFW4_9ROSI|nr:unnamed protein product [Dovyalis caffra]
MFGSTKRDLRFGSEVACEEAFSDPPRTSQDDTSKHEMSCYRFGAILLVFFFTSSKLTKVGEDKKRRIEAEFKEGGQRNWIQVVSNSGIATVLALAIWRLAGWEDKCLDGKESALITSLIGGIIGHYSCCNGDTWSSELGVLSDAQPRLITTFKKISSEKFNKWNKEKSNKQESEDGDYRALEKLWWSVGFRRGEEHREVNMEEDINGGHREGEESGQGAPVRRGTNGGVTLAGLLAAAAAGSVIGLAFVLLGLFTTKCVFDVALKQLLVIPVAALAGLCGSLIDSLLGATLQFSGFCTVRNKVVGKSGPTVKKISGLSILDNNAVNLVSVLLTTLLTSIGCSYIF